MKKLLYFLPVLVIFFASCGNTTLEPPALVGLGVDTVLTSVCEYESPVLAPRFDCKGNKLGHPKVIGWETKKCATVHLIGFNDTYLKDRGYQYVGKPVSVGPVYPSNGPRPLVGNSWLDYLEPWWFLFWMFLIFIAVLLWKFSRGDFDSKPAPAERVITSTPTPPTSSTMKEKSDAMSGIVKAMKENSVVTGEVNLGEGVTGKFTFASANKDKPVNKKPEGKKQ